MNSNELRARFLEYFRSQGHTVVPSSPLVPGNDPTLLFTNAGMVQFKDVFTGRETRSYKRAASSQKCVRAGGKHNDLENVGYTARHHTFFEMLGNFSFGDYFKEDAIRFAWEFITGKDWLNIPKSRLLVTVYHSDDEAFDLWHNKIGLPPERIVRIGDKPGGGSDNFWQMGDTGPCGPCTEIFYDHDPDGTKRIAGGPPGSPEEDGDRWIEIWNLVFMQFDRAQDGTLSKLPAPSVDTGMGLERVAAVMQGVHNNYDIDLFRSLIVAVAALAKIAPQSKEATSPSLKVIADHIRATSFLICDGVVPSNEGRGYVLRRIMRRAIRHGYKLVATLGEVMGSAYAELIDKRAVLERVIRQEEEAFAATLDKGMRLLEDAIAKASGGVIPGEAVFKLYDTYGFPLDLTADIARERGLTLDIAGYEREMKAQQDRSRAGGNFTADYSQGAVGNVLGDAKSEFTGYEQDANSAKVLAIISNGQAVERIEAGTEAVVFLDRTPFYAESGGQAGDQGVLLAGSARFEVSDTLKVQADVFGHHGTLVQGVLQVGDVLAAEVDTVRRARTIRNHSATHLMHKALREVLGPHVQQKGSLVDADKTRFDFAHNAPMTDDEIRRVEVIVNAEILRNAQVQAQLMAYDDAVKGGAMALFGEKYGDEVRVLDIGFSRELCGGVHVQRTGDIGLFKIVVEGGVAAGIRRVEAITGDNALRFVQQLDTLVNTAAAALKAQPAELTLRIGQVQEQVRTLEKELSQLKSKLASSQGDDLLSQAVEVGGVQVLAAVLDNADAKTLRETVDKLKDKLKHAAIVLAAVTDGKVSLIAGVTADASLKVKAGELVNFVAQQVGGKGGGRADMAQAGGTEPANLPAALAGVQAWVAGRL